MSREIKFRVWDKINEKWITTTQRWNNFSTFEEYSQYTGLKDKNGKEIYEGDIVKFNLFIETVVWGEYGDDEYVDKLECWMIGGYPLSSVAKSWGVRYNALETDPNTLEIIGNIFEHPNLIK